MIRLVLIAEIEGAMTEAEAQQQLDTFREATMPGQEWGICFYRATEAEADTGIYVQPEPIETCPHCGAGPADAEGEFPHFRDCQEA